MLHQKAIRSSHFMEMQCSYLQGFMICLKTQYMSTIERWTMWPQNAIWLYINMVLISQKNSISTCVLHLSTAATLSHSWNITLCADLHASLHETWEYSHKNHMIKLHPQMYFSAMWKHLKGLLCLWMAGLIGMRSFKMPEYDAYFCLKATIST